jgi:hypothetical protein
MLSNAQIRAVLAQLATGASHRVVARATGVSRTTVAQIARGERQERTEAPPCGESTVSTLATRCPTCGGKVYLIDGRCQLCYVRYSTAPAIELSALSAPAGLASPIDLYTTPSNPF